MDDDRAQLTERTIADRKVRSFDLAERTAAFGEEAIRFATAVRRDAVTTPLISQFVRSATSIGANYVEADEAGSKKEFRYRISVCKREARETQYWLRKVAAANPATKDSARNLWQEARELVLILESIYRNSSATPK